MPLAYVRTEGKAGRIGARLMAIAAEGNRRRHYLAPTEEHETAARVPIPTALRTPNSRRRRSGSGCRDTA